MAGRIKGQGSKWIRPAKRLAIYLRDGFACCYCGRAVEQGEALSLDHLVACSHGGNNEATNLVTCCGTCNSSRGNRPVKTFAAKVAGYIGGGLTARKILNHIARQTAKPLDLKAAKALMAERLGANEEKED